MTVRAKIDQAGNTNIAEDRFMTAYDIGIDEVAIDYSVFSAHAPVIGTAPIRMMIQVMAAAVNLSAADITQPHRKTTDVLLCRNAIIWVSRAILGYSWHRISLVICRDHTTVMNSFARSLEWRATNVQFRNLSWALACFIVAQQNRAALHLDPWGAANLPIINEERNAA